MFLHAKNDIAPKQRQRDKCQYENLMMTMPKFQ